MKYKKITIWRAFLPKTNYFSHVMFAYPPSVLASSPPLPPDARIPKSEPPRRAAMTPHVAPCPNRCGHAVAIGGGGVSVGDGEEGHRRAGRSPSWTEEPYAICNLLYMLS
jgi:hypothetical protein